MVDYIALVCQICIKEASKNHNLVIRESNAAKLRTLLVLKLSIQKDELPSLLLHEVWEGEVEPFDSAKRTSIVNCTTSTDRVDERLSK